MAKKRSKAAPLKEIAPGILQKNEKTYYIVCRISGKHCYCNKARLDALAKKFGGIDKIAGKYESRDAKRLLKAKTPVKSIQKMSKEELKAEASSIKIHKEKKKVERKAKRDTKKRIALRLNFGYVSSDDRRMFEEVFDGDKRCLRPHLFNSNRGYCNGCHWYTCCKQEIREWKEEADQPDRMDLVKKTFGKKKYVDIVGPK